MITKIFRITVIFIIFLALELLILLVLSISSSNDFVSIFAKCLTKDSYGPSCGNFLYFLIIGILLLLDFIIAYLLSNAKFFVQYPDWKNDVKNRLAQIQNSYSSKDIIKIKYALIEADKILDFALYRVGIMGKTTYERIKNAKKLFDNQTFQDLKRAHYIRNQVVHKVGAEFSIAELKKHFWSIRKGIIEIIH